jgi:hypothetical protein
VAGSAAKPKPRPRSNAKASKPWRLLEETRVAEQTVSSAKRGADNSLRIRRAAQAHEDLVETLTDLERLRVQCDELGGPAALEAFPPIPEPPAAVEDPLEWWESEERAAWESHLNRAANKLEDITKAGWKALIASISPAIPAEQILSNLEAASPELKRECASIRTLIAAWEALAKKKSPDKGDAASAQATAKAIEDSWVALEQAGGAPERLDLLTKLSTLPPTITLADLTEDDWEWLTETGLASSVYLSIWED